MPGEYFDPLPDIDNYIKHDPTVKALLVLKFNNAKEALLKEFENHPITKEIDAGPQAENSSGTLNGYGNLFSYIGFDAGDNPTDVIREIIGEMDASKSDLFGFKGQYFLRIENLPSIDAIYGQTPMPFLGGRSWILGIESDTIGGIAQYKRTDDASESRSSGGIQVKPIDRQYNKFSFTPTEYFTPMYERFLASIGAK